MTYGADGRVNQGRYWNLPEPSDDPEPGMSEDEACSEITRIFDESVRMRMIADVPLGAFLSGGIDSGSIVASMARQSERPVKTFSIGFEEADFNELPAAKLVAEEYKTEHYEILVRPDSVDLSPGSPTFSMNRFTIPLLFLPTSFRSSPPSMSGRASREMAAMNYSPDTKAFFVWIEPGALIEYPFRSAHLFPG